MIHTTKAKMMMSVNACLYHLRPDKTHTKNAPKHAKLIEAIESNCLTLHNTHPIHTTSLCSTSIIILSFSVNYHLHIYPKTKTKTLMMMTIKYI